MFQKIEAGVKKNSYAGQSVDQLQRLRVFHNHQEAEA